MADTLYLIVEGDGDERVAPVLVRRILHDRHQEYDFRLHAYNAHGADNLTKQLERFLELTRKQPDCVGVLVLRDAEREHVACPPGLGCELARRARVLKLPFPVAVVCATCEFESWFLADLRCAAYCLRANASYAGNPDSECGAKGWLARHMQPGTTYKESQDQVRMTANLRLGRVEKKSGSFRRMLHAVAELVQLIAESRPDVTPICN